MSNKAQEQKKDLLIFRIKILLFNIHKMKMNKTRMKTSISNEALSQLVTEKIAFPLDLTDISIYRVAPLLKIR